MTKIHIGAAKLNEMFALDLILDGSTGGFVIGNYHENCGVKLIRRIDEDHITIAAELEGWEYLLNPVATRLYHSRLLAINSVGSQINTQFFEYSIPPEVTTLDARPIDVNDNTTGRLILISNDNQWIINKYSTKKYLLELEDINDKTRH